MKEFGLDGCPMYFDLVGKDSYDHTRPAGGKAVQDSRSRRSRNAKFPGPTKQGDNELDHETLED